MRTEREYRSLASMLLRLATDPPRVSEDCAEGCPKVGSEGEEQRVVVGRIVDCDEMFFSRGRIKPARVHIDEYSPGEDIARKESSHYGRAAIAAYTCC